MMKNNYSKKISTTWHITIGNINSFMKNTGGTQQYKLDRLRQMVTQNNSDIVLMSEHVKNLTSIPFKNHPSEIMKK